MAEIHYDALLEYQASSKASHQLYMYSSLSPLLSPTDSNSPKHLSLCQQSWIAGPRALLPRQEQEALRTCALSRIVDVRWRATGKYAEYTGDVGDVDIN